MDIVETNFALEPVGQRRGVLGSAVVQDRVIQVLDVPKLVEDAFPGLIEPLETLDDVWEEEEGDEDGSGDESEDDIEHPEPDSDEEVASV